VSEDSANPRSTDHPIGNPVDAPARAARPCPACRSADLAETGWQVHGRYPLLRCRSCGLGALSADQDSGEGFDEYWTSINQRIYSEPAVLAELATKYERYFTEVRERVPNRRFLDVGSGAGVSIGAAARLGFQPLGVEPSEHAVALSRRLFEVPVQRGLVSADDQLPRDYGMVALWDVIEHVADPEALIHACAAHLAPGGVLLLETPDEGALLRRLIRGVGRSGIPALDLRSGIYYRAHRFYFTRTAMAALLRRCGFADVQFRAEHTMFRKELLKKQLYGHASRWRLLALDGVFRTLKALPVMANKMVVVATKSA
jgi:2-polyprenyl-3-methyl-5-hydroxy-6-metoxy-1,4-benzoquinol methylase